MVVSVVVCLRNMSISRLDGFPSMRRSRKRTSVTFVCGFELYVCVCVWFVYVLMRLGFVRLVSRVIKLSSTYLM